VREGRADPATSVRGATHIQVVSSATRDQADPATSIISRATRSGRRNFFLAEIRFSGIGSGLLYASNSTGKHVCELYYQRCVCLQRRSFLSNSYCCCTNMVRQKTE